MTSTALQKFQPNHRGKREQKKKEQSEIKQTVINQIEEKETMALSTFIMLIIITIKATTISHSLHPTQNVISSQSGKKEREREREKKKSSSMIWNDMRDVTNILSPELTSQAFECIEMTEVWIWILKIESAIDNATERQNRFYISNNKYVCNCRFHDRFMNEIHANLILNSEINYDCKFWFHAWKNIYLRCVLVERKSALIYRMCSMKFIDVVDNNHCIIIYSSSILASRQLSQCIRAPVWRRIPAWAWSKAVHLIGAASSSMYETA